MSAAPLDARSRRRVDDGDVNCGEVGEKVGTGFGRHEDSAGLGVRKSAVVEQLTNGLAEVTRRFDSQSAVQAYLNGR
jgi:hypothetical protein